MDGWRESVCANTNTNDGMGVLGIFVVSGALGRTQLCSLSHVEMNGCHPIWNSASG